MKKINKLTLVSTLSFILFTLGAINLNAASISEAIKLDVKTACNPNMGPKALLQTAKKFNPIAVKNEVEFMRFKVTNSQAIIETEKALKAGKSEVALLKKKKYTLTSVKDAAWRTCVFAIRALQMKAYADAGHYKDAIPGDGFKY